jgi:hypothetical protein
MISVVNGQWSTSVSTDQLSEKSVVSDVMITWPAVGQWPTFRVNCQVVTEWSAVVSSPMVDD